MEWRKIAVKIKGLQTISSICNTLNIGKETSINYIHELRKRGFVKTQRGKGMLRLYEITNMPKKQAGYPGLYDIINKYSAIKISKPFEHRIHDHELSIEEAIVRSIATKDFRTIIASLSLFKHVKDWKRLYRYAKKYHVRRQIGALYCIARKTGRVKRIDKRIEMHLLKSPLKERYIIKNAKSKDFKEIEKLWGIYIPFNKSDLARYKETNKASES